MNNIFNAKLIFSLFFLLVILIAALLYRSTIKEYFVSQIAKSYDTNEFKTIVLDKMDNYDIELAIPSGQYLYNTTQGNWGFSTDETNDGVVFGVYRDGYTADGSIFKGKTGKRFKYMLEQGPYLIRYEVRKNNDTDEHDVSIFVDDKLIKIAEGEGITSDKIKVIGTNYHNYNNEAKKDERGRRPVDYLKFVPKDVNGKSREGFTDNSSAQPNTNTNTNTNAYVHDTGFTNDQFKDLLNNTSLSGHTIVSTPTEAPTETPAQTPSNQPIESSTETSNQSTESTSNSNIADILSNLPSEITINHNVVYTKKKSDSDDYDSTSMSDNPYYGYMPNVQTSNPDALKSIGSKFFTGILQSMFT